MKIGGKKMKTHLSAYIILAGLITILTASGLITKNVYAARELTIVIRNLVTDEKFRCPNPLPPPIIVSATPISGKRPPSQVSISISTVYRSAAGEVTASFAIIDRYSPLPPPHHIPQNHTNIHDNPTHSGLVYIVGKLDINLITRSE